MYLNCRYLNAEHSDNEIIRVDLIGLSCVSNWWTKIKMGFEWKRNKTNNVKKGEIKKEENNSYVYFNSRLR